MTSQTKIALTALACLALAGCAGDEPTMPAATDAPPPPPPPPYRLDVPMQILMRGPVSIAAYDYWSSVSIVVDADGEHENFPETEEEWERVWSAALTLAELANVMMMPGRALDQGDWMDLSERFYDISLDAARIAEDEDALGVLDIGEAIYNVCVECHQQYVPALGIL